MLDRDSLLGQMRELWGFLFFWLCVVSFVAVNKTVYCRERNGILEREREKNAVKEKGGAAGAMFMSGRTL